MPNRGSVKCLDPGLQAVILSDSMCKGGYTTQAKPCPTMNPQEIGSKDPTTMEETCAREFPTCSGGDTTEYISRQSENIVLNMHMLYCTSFLASNILPSFLLSLFSLSHIIAGRGCNHYISYRKINHRGAQLLVQYMQ